VTTQPTTGRYRYTLDGVEIPVEERFTIEHQARGVVVAGFRTAPGTRLDVESVYRIDGTSHCSLAWTSELENTASSVRATYVVNLDGSVSATWVTEDGPEVAQSIDVAGGHAPSFFPLLRVFSGRSVAKLVAVAPTPLPVLVPDIRDPKNVERFLTPLLGDRLAASVEAGTCAVDGVDRACEVVDYRGGSYDSDATVYLDGGGLLLRYTWPQEGAGDWDVQLCEVEGNWPEPSLW
jgi:hypothetical protein